MSIANVMFRKPNTLKRFEMIMRCNDYLNIPRSHDFVSLFADFTKDELSWHFNDCQVSYHAWKTNVRYDNEVSLSFENIHVAGTKVSVFLTEHCCRVSWVPWPCACTLCRTMSFRRWKIQARKLLHDRHKFIVMTQMLAKSL